MSDEFRAGLADQDEMSQFPSAANPLDQLGLDPDQVRANPELLAGLSSGRTSDRGGPTQAKARLMQGPGAVAMPSGGDSAPSPSATSAGAAGGAGVAPTPSDPETVGMNALTTSLGNETKLASQVPTSDPDVTSLTAQQRALSAKEPLYDPQTGKMLEGDKPSLGTRVWRGVRGGLTGLAMGGIPGAIVGAVDPAKVTGEAYGAPNKAYQRREQTREQKLAGTETSLENARKNWKDAVDAMKTKGAILGDITKTGSDIVSGSSKLQGLEIKDQLKDATIENYKDKIDQQQKALAERWQQAQQTNATNEERISAMRDNAEMRNQMQQMQLQFQQQKLSTVTDARVLDNQEKEDVSAIEKRYSAGVTGLWNRAFGNKDQEIAATHKMYQDRRAALGVMPNAAPANPTAAPAAGGSGKGVSLAAARQLPRNRGKTDAQIQADIKSHGHQVTP